MRFLDPWANCILATLRIVAGYGFMLHGLQKLFGILGGTQQEILSLLWTAGAVELVGGSLIALGLFTRPVAFICSGEMAAAYFIGHIARSGAFLFPVVNDGERAVLYCFVFLYLAARGPGDWSVDGVLGKR